MTSDTPRTDACPHCGAAKLTGMITKAAWECGNATTFEGKRSELCREREARQKGEDRLKVAEDLIKGLHDGWKKARVAHLETCKNAQTEIDKLYTENVCLQELIQEFYEWTRRDYPTEAEVREIMNRYHHILNK